MECQSTDETLENILLIEMDEEINLVLDENFEQYAESDEENNEPINPETETCGASAADICECELGDEVKLIWKAESKYTMRIPQNSGIARHGQAEGDVQLSTSSTIDDEHKFECLIYRADYKNANIDDAVMFRYKDTRGLFCYLTATGSSVRGEQAYYVYDMDGHPVNPRYDHVFLLHFVSEKTYALEYLSKCGYFLAHQKLKGSRGYKLALIEEMDHKANSETHFCLYDL